MTRRETFFLGIVVALLGGALGLDRFVPARPTPAPGPATSVSRFLSSGSYCPLPPSSDETVVSTVATANLGSQPVRLRRWGVADSKATPFQEGDLGARTRSAAGQNELGIGEGVGIVDAFGSATVSDAEVSARGAGMTWAACSVQPWTRWLFAAASTARGLNTYLLLANPFQEEAVVRVRVMSPEADTVPARLKDVVVPRLAQVRIFLAEYVPETALFGLEVTATRGRVVAARYLRAATRDGLRGIDLDLGAHESGTRWLFAAGEVPEGGEESIVLVNPSARESLVQVIVQTEHEQLAPQGLQEVAVPAGRQVVVRMADHIPRGTRHGTSVVSTNGVPIVAERQTVAVVGGARRIESQLGVAGAGPRWSVPVGSREGGRASLELANAEHAPAVVGIGLITDGGEVRPPELAAVRVEAGRRLSLDLTPFLGGGSATAVVEAASGQVVVEGRAELDDPYRDFAESPARGF